MFWKKKEKKKYKPTNRIGIYRVSDYPYIFTIAMEKICEVGNKSRVKLLEIGKSCDKTDQECLRHAKFQDWVPTNLITWETDAQYHERINRVEPAGNEVFITPDEPTVDYTPHATNPFVHNFIQNREVFDRPILNPEHEILFYDNDDTIPF